MTEQSIEQATKIISDCLMVPVDKIDPAANIQQLGQIDSLVLEMICMQMEKCVGQEIDFVSMMHVETVNDLAEVIEEYKNL